MERRSTPRPALAVAARVAVAALFVASLGLAGCASTPEEEAPVEAFDPPVTARALAATLGLHQRRSSDGIVYLESRGADRIALFPGTHIATVCGVRYDVDERLLPQGGELWIGGFDARVLEKMWRQGQTGVPVRAPVGTVAGGPAPSGTRRRLTLDDLPPPPPTASTAGTGVPADLRLTAAERKAWAVPLRRPWQYIVVHHSATPAGNAAAFDQAHKDRGWDGLGYHFVIGNGNKSADGRIEVGFRWEQQREGAHAGVPLMNQRGIGICLVGDFDKTSPTPAQMRSLERLCGFLSAYCNIPSSGLRLHRDFRETHCPGRHFPKSFALRPRASVRGAADTGAPRGSRPR